MRFGDSLEYFQDIEEDTGKTPKPLQDRPDLPTHLIGTLEAFLLLSGSRSCGFGFPNPIGTRDALALAPFAESEDAMRFLRTIRAMDALFLEEFDRTHGSKARHKPAR